MSRVHSCPRRHHSAQSRGDLILSLSHADCDLDQGVGDGFVRAQLHELRRHRDAELGSHFGDLLLLRLGAEGGSESVERLLSGHETLELGRRVVILDSVLILDLLLGSLLVSLSNGVFHLSLHLGSLNTSLLNRHVLVVVTDVDRGRRSGHDSKNDGSHIELKL